jgi:uncharacterized membrane protein
MASTASSPPFVHLSVPNRSLGPAGRRWALAAIAATTLGVGTFAAAIGAWPVMPFAGLEVALLALAFRVVQAHDADYERVEVGEHEVVVEGRDARKQYRFVANRAWARVVVGRSGGRCTLQLAYAGRSVPLGRMMSDAGRRRLARALRGRMAVTVKQGFSGNNKGSRQCF